MNSDVAAIGQLLGNHLGIGWTSTAHTADLVPILALGPGAELFSGYIQNVDIFRHYTQLAGIEFENPKGQEVADARGGAEEHVAEYAQVVV
jgi:alkaline phosphatase